MSKSSRAGALVWGAVAFLAIAHWDFWFWADQTLLFGFMPIGLAYQAAFSIVAALVWTAAVRYAWPADLEAWAQSDAKNDVDSGASRGKAS